MPPNPFVSLGHSVHRALEDYHLKHGSTFDDMMESLNKEWVNEGFESPSQVQDFYERGQRMLENYWQSNKDIKSEIIHVEKEFRFRLGKNILRGIIDRIDRTEDGKYEVIDYKTHRELWSSSRIENDMQISIYSLACEKALGFKPDILSYYFLSHDKKISVKRPDSRIKEAVRMIEETADLIKKQVFTPNTTGCAKCDFSGSCANSTAGRSVRNNGKNIGH